MRCLSTGGVGIPFSARLHSRWSGRHPDGMPVEGQRMSQDSGFTHLPVMATEIVALMAPLPPGVVLDATVGGGGHARRILEAHPHLELVGLDRDPAALAAAGMALAPFGRRAVLRQARFDRLGEILDDLGIDALSGALFDLGVSSPQLDTAARGFSYRADAPLDMRMGPDARHTAADVVNGWSLGDLARLFAANGERRFAGRIARAVVAARPLTTTTELAEVVRAAIPAAARRTGGHPARRVFQAVRIAVNEELDVLPPALDEAIDRLAPGGRIVVLAYHSGEDRIVKARLLAAAGGDCICPPGLPCVCGARPRVRLLNRGARKPGAEEVAANHRAESARLRAAEKLPAADDSPPDDRAATP